MKIDEKKCVIVTTSHKHFPVLFDICRKLVCVLRNANLVNSHSSQDRKKKQEKHQLKNEEVGKTFVDKTKEDLDQKKQLPSFVQWNRTCDFSTRVSTLNHENGVVSAAARGTVSIAKLIKYLQIVSIVCVVLFSKNVIIDDFSTRKSAEGCESQTNRL